LHPSILAKRAWLLLFIAISAFYLWGLGYLPLVGPDEPRYAQVAREMLLRRDLITPTLGGMPWFEKPPLLYWMMMLSFHVFGVSEQAARLGPALCGLMTAGFIYWIGRQIGHATRNTGGPFDDAIGRWSALFWLSSLGAITFSRAASFDIVLTMTVTGAFAFFISYETHAPELTFSVRRNSNAKLLVGFYFFAGLSTLAKGLVGFVIVFGVVALYYILPRERPSRGLALSLVWGVPLSLAIAAAWFVPMLAIHGRIFADQFIVQHHFERFLSNKYHHPGPIYFYVPVVIALALPWTLALGGAILSARHWTWRGSNAVDRLRVLALIWLILPIAFFSFSGSKLVAYILPVLPAIALLAGERMTCALRAARGQTLVFLTGATCIALAAAGNWYVYGHFDLTRSCLIFATAPLLIVGSAALIRPQLQKPLLVLSSVGIILSSAVALKCAAPVVARPESVRDLLLAAAARGYVRTPVTQLHTIERTAEFYAAGRLTYQPDGEPIKFEGVMQVVEAARRYNGTVLCLVPLQFQSQLTSFAGAETDLIGDNGRVVLIAVRVKE